MTTFAPDHTFQTASFTAEFRDRMSAHEAGHATLGRCLGARIEAVYARIMSRRANGDFRVAFLTRFEAAGWPELAFEDKILSVAGGAAGEMLLLEGWEDGQVSVDRRILKERGFDNFNYCAEHATRLLERNKPLLVATRDIIRARMSDLKHCELAKGGSHIILAKGSEIEGLFLEIGSQVNRIEFELEAARTGVDGTSS
jgi:hypothetical protein